MNLIKLLKTHQQELVLLVGYILVAFIGFTTGHFVTARHTPPEIRVEESFSYVNNTSKDDQTQSTGTPIKSTDTGQKCSDQIKGNINSKGEKIYHLPRGAFYERTDPEECFKTETEAIQRGYKKSSK